MYYTNETFFSLVTVHLVLQEHLWIFDIIPDLGNSWAPAIIKTIEEANIFKQFGHYGGLRVYWIGGSTDRKTNKTFRWSIYKFHNGGIKYHLFSILIPFFSVCLDLNLKKSRSLLFKMLGINSQKNDIMFVQTLDSIRLMLVIYSDYNFSLIINDHFVLEVKMVCVWSWVVLPINLGFALN